MVILKCKMCGGDLEVNENASIGTCQYCNSTMTLPKIDDDRRANLYDRANYYRRNNEFDKAMAIYENILSEDKTDAEAYWSLVLCKYGVEYVEDPKTNKRVPTCNRTQMTSIFVDEDYKSAIQHADINAISIYENEARAIDKIQKDILEIVSREDSFDIFICYKETDDFGRRTPDSVHAQELYNALTEEGFKVFFSRITLEDILGAAYEPYIFAALHSAKVMVVVGTKAEYFNAVWVKNEWSRYLSLINKGEKKTLIPAYKDMNPYELPEEFVHLQAQDMGKLGFIQDLIRGIKKIISVSRPKTIEKDSSVAKDNIITKPLLDKSFEYIKEGNYTKAENLLEQVLIYDPESSRAFIGYLMMKLDVKTEKDLKHNSTTLTNYAEYQEAVSFADEDYKTILLSYNQTIIERLEEERKERAFQKAIEQKNEAKDEFEYRSIAGIFRSMSGYKDSASLALDCDELAEQSRIEKERIEEEKRIKNENYRIEKEHRAKQEHIEAKRVKKVAIILLPFIIAATAYFVILNHIFIPAEKYSEAMELLKNEQYTEAAVIFREIKKYKDSAEKLEIINTEERYIVALDLLENKQYRQAVNAFQGLEEYKDSAEKLESINPARYSDALDLLEDKQYEEAAFILRELGGYEDSVEKLESIIPAQYSDAMELYKNNQYEEAAIIFRVLEDYKDSEDKLESIALLQESIYIERRYINAMELINDNHYESAAYILRDLGDYKDSPERLETINLIIYKDAMELLKSKHYNRAGNILRGLDGYKDSEDIYALIQRLDNAIKNGHHYSVVLTYSGQLEEISKKY